MIHRHRSSKVCQVTAGKNKLQCNFFEDLTVLEDRDSATTLGDHDSHRTCHLGHRRYRIMPGSHAFGEGDVTGINGNIPPRRFYEPVAGDPAGQTP